MQESRTKNSVRNISFSLIYYVAQIVLTFLVRILFLRVFVEEFLGVNTLFSNIINILSVVESGFGSAIVFALYKPVAENDEQKVRQLVRLYKKYYSIIALIVCGLGLLITPFLPVLIKDFHNINLNLYLLFLVFLTSSIITYLTAHRRALFYTSQRSDIETKINMVGYFTTIIVQILAILVFKNYYVYAIAGLINVVVISTLIVFVTDRKYKRFLIKPNEAINKEESKKITKNVFALIYHKIGGIVLTATDSLILSAFIGSAILGKYANYLFITTSLNTLLAIIVGSMKGSVGNLIVTEDTDTSYKLFKRFNMMYVFITTFATICFVCLANPFISLFFGSDLLLSTSAVVVIGLNLFVLNLRQIVYVFKDCKGLFKENKYAPLIESAINLILSIVLVNYLGLVGVLLGTILSAVLVPVWNEPYILFKHYFKKSVWNCYKTYLRDILIMVVVGLICFVVCWFIPCGSIWLLILKFAVCAVLTFALLVLTYLPTKEFKANVVWLKDLAKSFFKKNK